MAVGEVHLFDECFRSGPEEPVDRRGWCLQELLMSSRALIFASTTLRFRCQNTTLNVGNTLYRTGNTLYETDDIRLPDIVLHPTPLAIQPGSEEWHHAHAGWALVVRQYSGRTLGEVSDKLVACGALAEAFHRVLGCDYLAGLWRDTLFEDLLWDNWTEDSGYVKDRPAEYRAPSWSWAAFDGKVRLPLHQSSPKLRKPLAEVIHCEVILKDPALPFGEVIGGSLVLLARLIPCKLREVVPRHFKNEVEILLPRPPPNWHPGGLRFVDEDSAIAGDRKLLSTVLVDYFSDLFWIERRSAWLIPCWCSTAADRRQRLHGLIVALENTDTGSATENRKVCRRIGVFCSLSPRDHNWDELRGYALEEEEVEIV